MTGEFGLSFYPSLCFDARRSRQGSHSPFDSACLYSQKLMIIMDKF
jgi:hypothetical protein